MALKNLAAYTASNNDYPAFINVSQLENGNYSVTVRSQGNGGKDIGDIQLEPEAFEVFLQTLNENVDVQPHQKQG